MPSSDTNVEVRITGTVDSSLGSATTAAKNEINTLATQSQTSAKDMAAALKAAGNDLSKITPDMLGLGAATSGVAAATAESEAAMKAGKAAMDGITVSTSRLSRETVVLTRELVAGNYSRFPGSLIVMGEAFGGLSLSMLAAAGAAAAVTAGVGYLVYEEFAARKTLDGLTEGFALTGRAAQFSKDDISDLRDFLSGLPGVSNAAATGFLQFAAANGEVTKGLASQTGQLLPAFIKAYGDKGPEAVEKLTKSLATLSVEGFRKLDTDLLNLTPQQYQMIENLIKTGDTAKAVSAILEQLSKQSDTYVKSTGDRIYDIEQQIAALKDRLGKLMTPEALARYPELVELERKLNDLKNIQAKEGQERSDATYKNALKDAERLNESLDQQGQILQQIGRYQDHLNEARRNGDTQGVATFTAAISNEQQKLAELQTSSNEKLYRDFLTKENAKADAFKRGSSERISILQGEVQRAAQLFGTESTQYQQALGRLNAEKRASSDQVIRDDQRTNAEFIASLDETVRQINQIRNQDTERELRASQARISAERNTLDAQVALGQISAAERYAIMAGLLNNEADLQIASLERDKKLAGDDLARRNADANKIREIWEKLNNDLTVLGQQRTNDTIRENQRQLESYRQLTRALLSAESQFVSNVLRGRMSLGQSILQLSGNLIEEELQHDFRYLTERLIYSEAEIAANRALDQGGVLFHAETESAKTAATIAGATARGAAESAAQSEGMAASVASGSAQIMNDASKAAAGAYQAVVGIPVVGPILAPVAAGVAFAAVAAFDTLTSAEGGELMVREGFYHLHDREAVMPAQIAEPMRQFFTEGGPSGQASGGRGDVHLHFGNVLDGPSLGAWLNKNRGLIQRAVRTA